jgi:hypothetical protein
VRQNVPFMQAMVPFKLSRSHKVEERWRKKAQSHVLWRERKIWNCTVVVQKSLLATIPKKAISTLCPNHHINYFNSKFKKTFPPSTFYNHLSFYSSSNILSSFFSSSFFFSAFFHLSIFLISIIFSSHFAERRTNV